MLDKTKLNYAPNTLLYCKPNLTYHTIVRYIVDQLNIEIELGTACEPSWRVRYPDLSKDLSSEVHSIILYVQHVLDISYPSYIFKVKHEYLCGVSFSVTLQNELKKI